MPSRTAIMAACVRFVTPSFRKIAATCALTVSSETNRFCAIERLLRPSSQERKDLVLALRQV